MDREAALEAGAEDVATNEDGSIEVISSFADFLNVKEALEKAGFKLSPEVASILAMVVNLGAYATAIIRAATSRDWTGPRGSG